MMEGHWIHIGIVTLVGLFGVRHLETLIPPTPSSTSVQVSMLELRPHTLAVKPIPLQPSPQLSSASSSKRVTATPQNNIDQAHTTSPHSPEPKAETERAALGSEKLIWIRIAVARQSQLEVAVSEPTVLVDAEDQPVVQLTAAQSYAVSLTNRGLQIGDATVPNGVWIKPGEDGLVWVNGHWFRGSMQIVFDGTSLLAVNWVELEQYLVSVTGSEMPQHWPLEALKAQAVAARSYALFHLFQPASQWYDLGCDERWQAYRGVETETERTEAAVAATPGQVLVDRNGQILEALYAASDHLTQIAHKGFGMSQVGAEQLAKTGRHHLEILDHYYPSAAIAVLEEYHD